MSDSTIKVVIEENAIQILPAVLHDLSETEKVLLIADNNTYRIMGARVKQSLISAGFIVQEIILQSNGQLVPDEKALGEILIKMESDIGVLVSVGSGSITDLTRYISYKFGKSFVAVATAPSMDGYASSVAPLTINGFKQTLTAVPPNAIFAEPAILAAAPKEMILAGFGDLLGKYTSLADWQLSQIINQEKYSDEIAAMVRSAVDKTVVHFDNPITDQNLIKNLTEALIISGEAILQWGNSRPASGAEHHMAHFWEMQDALLGRKNHLHGTKVGIAVILVAEVYHQLFKLDIEEVKQLIDESKPETELEYNQRIKRVYGVLADDILADLKGYYLDLEKRADRQRMILKNWESLQAWVNQYVPSGEKIREFMVRAGAPVDAEQIDVDAEMLHMALENAKEVRTRYTVFRLAEDIGWKLRLG
jgi:glycerol-1-phosphate dehydrogenase [NAD(P)+]